MPPDTLVQARIDPAIRDKATEVLRGMGHGGTLNFGDTFAYALARTLDAPLLFIGDDFGTTDVAAALDDG